MAFLAHTQRPSGAIPTSSMADVAFLLLVFFLVTTVFPRDRGLALALPHETTPVSPANVLFILISESGTIELRQGESQQGQQVTVGQVEDVWRQRVRENPDLIAAVETSPDASYGAMIDVLDALQSARAQRISLDVRR